MSDGRRYTAALVDIEHVLSLKATHAGALEERVRCTKGKSAMEGAKLMLEQLQRSKQVRDSSNPR